MIDAESSRIDGGDSSDMIPEPDTAVTTESNAQRATIIGVMTRVKTPGCCLDASCDDVSTRKFGLKLVYYISLFEGFRDA